MPLYKIFHFDRRQYETEGSTDFQGAGTKGDANTYIYRLAETYLLRAEARLYLGDVAGATQDVNTIRQRAQASWLYESVNIGDIMDERARELYLEEYRKAELTRVSMCLAMSGIPDEWGNTYSIEDWNKQSGTQTDGGSYWYQRLMHHSLYNKGKVGTSYETFNYTMNKRNLFWPIPDYGQQHFRRIKQNYGYPDTTCYDKMWETWQEADEDARR